MKASRKRTAGANRPGTKVDRKSAAKTDAASKSKTVSDEREVATVDGGRARRRLDRPARKRFADGGNVTDGLRSFQAIEQAFAPPGGDGYGPPPPSLRSPPNMMALPTPYGEQNSHFVVPSLSPTEMLARYKQEVVPRVTPMPSVPNLLKANGGAVRGGKGKKPA